LKFSAKSFRNKSDGFFKRQSASIDKIEQISFGRYKSTSSKIENQHRKSGK